MNYPTLRFVFDRKKVATKTVKGLVQIEVYSNPKRKYITTGVKVFKNEWSDSTQVKNRKDAASLNETLDILMQNLKDWLNDLRRNKEAFSFELLDRHLKEEEDSSNFLEFMEEGIENRNIRKSTKVNQRCCLTKLKEFQKILTFNDLTRRNITLFDKFLQSKGFEQSTIHKYHKTLKCYINEAIALQKITYSPYINIQVSKGTRKKVKCLLPQEIQQVKNVVLEDKTLQHARDCFMFCCYTGLGYSDLKKFDFTKVVVFEDSYMIDDERVKTNITYQIVLLPGAIEILKKYDFKLPVVCLQQYNVRLKLVAHYAGIKKRLTSHMARHTFATYAHSSGIEMKTLGRMLGQTKIQTTEMYVELLPTEVISSYLKLKENIFY